MWENNEIRTMEPETCERRIRTGKSEGNGSEASGESGTSDRLAEPEAAASASAGRYLFSDRKRRRITSATGIPSTLLCSHERTSR